MNLNQAGKLLWKIASRFLPAMSSPSLQTLADRFEEELADRTFVYTFQSKNGKKYQAPVEFDRSGFCHLFSISSIVKDITPDTSEFSGMKGWRNIKDGKITFSLLKRLNPSDYAYYEKEYQMTEQLFETVRNPRAVLFDARKVPGSRLKSDILLYQVFGNRTVHIGICEDKDGTWFARSYFIRENSQDKQYPTKYIAPMEPLNVKVKVSSKKA